MRRALLAVVLALAFPAGALAWGGTYPTGDALGISIHIDVSDAYPVDQTLPQTWATFFGTLVHGPELASLNLRLAPSNVVSSICGAGTLACYDPETATIEASPVDQLNGPTAREIVIHEYGHHISANRSNAPWRAEDWGTKRWATYEHVCTRVKNGGAAPGDEGADYSLNPGEAFAEAYRVLNLTREGVTPITWQIVDDSFYPDATALSLLEQDVESPWTGPTVVQVRNGRTIRVATPLDGTFTALLHAPANAQLRLMLYAGAKLVRSGFRSLRYQICGSRLLTLRVAGGAQVPYTVDVSKP